MNDTTINGRGVAADLFKRFMLTNGSQWANEFEFSIDRRFFELGFTETDKELIQGHIYNGRLLGIPCVVGDFPFQMRIRDTHYPYIYILDELTSEAV